MKKHVIIGWASQIGGAQIYTKGMCKVLASNGWQPIVFYSGDKYIVIEELQQYATKYYKELSFLPSYYSKKHREKILKEMISFLDIKENDEILIETNDVRYAYWGELLAERLKCKHFAFLLEAYFGRHENNFDFFKFKLDRDELAGTRITSLPDLFKGKNVITEENNVYFKAAIIGSLEEISSDLDIDYSKYDIRIGHVGRDSKPYVATFYNQFDLFAKRYQDKKILLLMIGGESDSIQGKKLKELEKRNENITVVSSGQMFPIPAVVVRNMDVCIGSSGCLRVINRCGVKAIAYLDDGEAPCGVLGYDIKNIPVERVYQKSLNELLSAVLFEGYCENFGYSEVYLHQDKQEEYNLLWKNVQYMMKKTDRVYYDTALILGPRKSIRIWQKTIGKIFPIGNIFNKIFK